MDTDRLARSEEEVQLEVDDKKVEDQTEEEVSRRQVVEAANCFGEHDHMLQHAHAMGAADSM